jgi:hypothetical protein
MNSEPTPIVIPDTFKPIKRNRWVVYEEPKFCQYFCLWYAEFPAGGMLNLWEQWAFAKELLRAGQEEGIYRIISTVAEKPKRNETATYGRYEISSGQSYNDNVEQILREQGKLRFFNDLGYSLASTRVCHYDLQGKIVETDIPVEGYRFSELLCGLRPDIDQEENRLYLSSSYPPIQLRNYAGMGFGISTNTDIWFPKLLGFMEDNTEQPEIMERDEWGRYLVDENCNPILKPGWEVMVHWYDNQELAERHTPRFNNFIQRVKQLVLTYGGTWKIDKEACMEGYRPQWNEDGIVLDC